MKKLSAYISEIRNSRAGFTLIELLVVIAIIGILAVAVLAAINPIEQINKGRDTQANADASQLVSAIERYYTNANPPAYPWSVATGSYSVPTGSAAPEDAYKMDSVTGAIDWGWLENLAVTQEVKDTFANRLKNSKSLIIFKAAGANVPTYACYYPTSNSGKKNADAYCATNEATINAASGMTLCSTTTGATNVICVP